MALIRRLNKGKPEGSEVVTFDNWSVYSLGDDENGAKFKVVARDPVTGCANYAFYVTKGRIDSRNAQRYSDLREKRPRLFNLLTDYFLEKHHSEHGATISDTDTSDPYGDLTLRRGKKLDRNQEWRRQLLAFRRQELEQAALSNATIWEAGVRALHAALYNEKISEGKLQESLRYITQRTVPIDIHALLEIERAYYAGKFKPHSSAKLAAALDNLANNQTGYENEEESNGSREDKYDSGAGIRDTGGAQSATAESPRPQEIDYSIFE